VLYLQAEDAYAKAIQRALTALKTGKTPLDLQRNNNPALGSSSTKIIERAIEHESAELVRMHEVFARRCREQLEVPLRSRATKDDWTAAQRQERNTEALLRDYEDAQMRLHKVGYPYCPTSSVS
jgi:rubrerythrin